MTYVFEDRITALERKSTQGATLSPVKLWSGNTQIINTTKITLPESSLNYKVFQICCMLFAEGNFILTRGQTTGIQDDIGGAERCSCSTRIESNTVTFTQTGSNRHTNLIIKEVWGIG